MVLKRDFFDRVCYACFGIMINYMVLKLVLVVSPSAFSFGIMINNMVLKHKEKSL